MNTDDPPEWFSLMTRAEPRVAIHFDVDTIDVRLRAFWGRRPVVESSQTEKFWERGPRHGLTARPVQTSARPKCPTWNEHVGAPAVCASTCGSRTTPRTGWTLT